MKWQKTTSAPESTGCLLDVLDMLCLRPVDPRLEFSALTRAFCGILMEVAVLRPCPPACSAEVASNGLESMWPATVQRCECHASGWILLTRKVPLAVVVFNSLLLTPFWRCVLVWLQICWVDRCLKWHLWLQIWQVLTLRFYAVWVTVCASEPQFMKETLGCPVGSVLASLPQYSSLTASAYWGHVCLGDVL